MLSKILLFLIIGIASSNNLKIYTDHQGNKGQIINQTFVDDGTFPNSRYPVIVYKDMIDFSKGNGLVAVESLFQRNGWGNSWRNGIYDYHHFHSTAHEVLGVYSGKADVQLGGPKNGESFYLKKGDVILIPAGVAHKKLRSSEDFRVVGAYPEGQSWDMNYGKEGERPGVDENIRKVPFPDKDPVYGESGPMHSFWQ